MLIGTKDWLDKILQWQDLLLYGALLASGGECAESLAINVSGNIESFVEKMNKQSASFSLENTNFTNVTGMDDKGHIVLQKI